jgi:Protein of unknown function (DUF4058)
MLPAIATQLSPDDPDVPLDFEEVFNRSYDIDPYRREIEYGKEPIVPGLKPEMAEWAAAVFNPRRRRT